MFPSIKMGHIIVIIAIIVIALIVIVITIINAVVTDIVIFLHICGNVEFSE